MDPRETFKKFKKEEFRIVYFDGSFGIETGSDFLEAGKQIIAASQQGERPVDFRVIDPRFANSVAYFCLLSGEQRNYIDRVISYFGYTPVSMENPASDGRYYHLQKKID